jgi:hypothetical protein
VTRPAPADIRAHRQKCGLSQRGAAELIGFSLRAWQGWEYGLRRFPNATLWAIWRKRADGVARRQGAEKVPSPESD